MRLHRVVVSLAKVQACQRPVVLNDVVHSCVDQIESSVLSHNRLERVGQRVRNGAAHVESFHQRRLEPRQGEVFAISWPSPRLGFSKELDITKKKKKTKQKTKKKKK